MKKILISLVALVAMSLGAYAQKFAMVDMEYMSELMGKSEEELLRALIVSDLITIHYESTENPTEVLKSYVNKKYSGDILRLLEPAHNIYPYVLIIAHILIMFKIYKRHSL